MVEICNICDEKIGFLSKYYSCVDGKLRCIPCFRKYLKQIEEKIKKEITKEENLIEKENMKNKNEKKEEFHPINKEHKAFENEEDFQKFVKQHRGIEDMLKMFEEPESYLSIKSGIGALQLTKCPHCDATNIKYFIPKQIEQKIRDMANKLLGDFSDINVTSNSILGLALCRNCGHFWDTEYFYKQNF